MKKVNTDLYKVNKNPDLVHDDHFELMTQVIHLAGLFEQVAIKGVSSELSFTQIKILSMIQAGICNKSSDLATHLHVTKANMTGMIGRLEKNGYVDRVENENDYRVKILKLSQKGEEYIASTRPKFFELVNETFRDLDIEQVKQVNDCLTQCITGMTKVIS